MSETSGSRLSLFKLNQIIKKVNLSKIYFMHNKLRFYDSDKNDVIMSACQETLRVATKNKQAKQTYGSRVGHSCIAFSCSMCHYAFL